MEGGEDKKGESCVYHGNEVTSPPSALLPQAPALLHTQSTLWSAAERYVRQLKIKYKPFLERNM